MDHDRGVNVFRLPLLSLVAALALTGAGCADSDDGSGATVPTGSVTIDGSSADAEPISVGELLDREVEARPGDTVLVAAFLVGDGSGFRMCEALAESFPPQCGGRSIEVRNPDLVDAELTEEQGVQWTERDVWLLGWVEDGAFVVT